MTNYNFIHDLVVVLREKALKAKKEVTTGGDFEKGLHMAYYDVISLIQQQAETFGIEPNKIGLENFNADKDAL